jgi:hypothetical protein
MKMKNTRTVALDILAVKKIQNICKEIKDSTGEFVSTGIMVSFLIEKLGRFGKELYIKKILEEREHSLNLTEAEISEILEVIDKTK